MQAVVVWIAIADINGLQEEGVACSGSLRDGAVKSLLILSIRLL